MKPGFTIEDSTTNDLLNTDSIHKEKYFRLRPAVALYHCPTPLICFLSQYLRRLY